MREKKMPICGDFQEIGGHSPPKVLLRFDKQGEKTCFDI